MAKYFLWGVLDSGIHSPPLAQKGMAVAPIALAITVRIFTGLHDKNASSYLLRTECCALNGWCSVTGCINPTPARQVLRSFSWCRKPYPLASAGHAPYSKGSSSAHSGGGEQLGQKPPDRKPPGCQATGNLLTMGAEGDDSLLPMEETLETDQRGTQEGPEVQPRTSERPA